MFHQIIKYVVVASTCFRPVLSDRVWARPSASSLSFRLVAAVEDLSESELFTDSLFQFFGLTQGVGVHSSDRPGGVFLIVRGVQWAVFGGMTVIKEKKSSYMTL